MDGAAYEAILDWVLAHGYFVLFLTMLVEGPVVTFAAGFAAALGYFNLPIVLALSFFGDWITDIAYYALGYWGRVGVAERYGHRIGLTKERMEAIEQRLKHHAVKTLVLLKFVPVLPTFGLIAVGALRIPVRMFITAVTLIIIPRTLFFALVGYYFGEAYKTVLPAVSAVQYTLLAGVLGAGALYWGYKKLSKRISDKAGF
jgi:membrane protein DedA with SNARE-associated domain